jgi:cell division protein FtsZ
MISNLTHTKHTPIFAKQPSLKVIGLGGGGCNAINRMMELGIPGVDFIGANTDHQALVNCHAPTQIQLGPKSTRGLGSGGNPKVGEAAAEESAREIAQALDGADMVFIAAGMGGGTGTGSSHVVAKIARALGAVTVSVVSTPFAFEMGKRQRNSAEGILKLRQYSDTLICVPNDKLLQVAPPDLPMEMAFRLADDVLRQGVQGIAELITMPGLVNIDFAHIRNIMLMGGGALLSMGQGEGQNKARKAIDQAIHHPLMDEVDLASAKGIIANFTCGPDMNFQEVTEAMGYLQEMTGNQAEIIPGFITDDRFFDRTEVILVITGLGGTAVDETIFSSSRAQAVAPIPEMPVEPQTIIISEDNAGIGQRFLSPDLPSNVDLPAFLRRRKENGAANRGG